MKELIPPTSAQLLDVIQIQTAIAKLGIDLNAIMTLVAQQAQQMTPSKAAVIELAEGDDMVYRAVSDGASDLLGLRLSRCNSLSGLCVAEKQTLYCQDSELDSRVDKEACRKVGLRSMAVVPLIYSDEAVGVIKIYSEQCDAFQSEHLNLLILMSDLIAAAMYHASKFRQQELYKLATQDALTGLANRALFLDCLRQGIKKAQQHQQSFIVYMVDMDGLKTINDVYGHRIGDEAIKELACRVKNSVSEQDLVARLGGDEFAIMLIPRSKDIDMVAIMNRVLEACGMPFSFENIELNLSASIGSALYPQHGLDPEHLLEHADFEMYNNKRQKHAHKSAKINTK